MVIMLNTAVRDLANGNSDMHILNSTSSKNNMGIRFCYLLIHY